MTPTPTTELITTPVQPAPRVPLNEMLALIRDTELVGTYGREIIESQIAINRFDQDWRLARVFAESGLFADAQAVNQAMTKVQLGRSWNMQPSDAMQHVYFVNGKPAVQNEYLAAKMRDAGMDWDIEWHKDNEGACIGVTLWPRKLSVGGGYDPIMERRGQESVPASVSFMKTDADRVTVKEDGKWIKLSEKSTYKAWPDDMYFWRAIARLRRRYATNILSGVMSRDEADDVAPPAVDAPREKQIAPVTDFMPGKQARKRAGAEDVAGTVKVDTPAPTVDEKKPSTAPATVQADAPASTAPAAIVLPWPNAEGMKQVLDAQRFRIGAAAYSDALSAGGWVLGDIKPEGGASVTFYAALKALPDEPTATEALPWANHDGMVACFRAQWARLGAPKCETILSAKAGYSFSQQSNHEDPQTLAFYRELEAVASDAPTQGAKKKLF